MRIFQLVSFCIFCCIGYAHAQDTFTKGQYEAFVGIYMDQKLFIPPPAVSLDSLLTRYQVPKERYAELVSPFTYNKLSDMPSNELKLVEAIKKENDEIVKQKNEMIRAACSDSILSYEIYRQILHAYQTDIGFQRSLKPYFVQYFNRGK